MSLIIEYHKIFFSFHCALSSLFSVSESRYSWDTGIENLEILFFSPNEKKNFFPLIFKLHDVTYAILNYKRLVE